MEKQHLDYITIRGARVNNLKNINCKIPRDKLTVITGLSGSGKSSLAFDTIFAEGQRRYVQSMSSYARQFLGTMEKPDVDEIKGLSPALSIDQKTSARSPRSTVGTMSEIYDYLRLMFMHIGIFRCDCPSKQKIFSSKNKNATVQKCHQCQQIFTRPTMSSFSFNSPEGACLECQGLGVKLEIDPNLVIPNTKLTLNEGAVRPWQRMLSGWQWQKKEMQNFSKDNKFSFNTPINKLSPRIIKSIIFGDENTNFLGILSMIKKKYRETNSEYTKKEIEKYMIKKICPICQGARLKKETLMVKIKNKNIYQYCQMDLEKLLIEIRMLTYAKILSPEECEIIKPILDEIEKRIQFMIDVGLSYLALERNSDTLAGGEAQRIRLATQLGSGLMGVIYILDEPTIGLHPKDQQQLINALITLRDLGNTIIVVEHESSIIKKADYILDIGPGAGKYGGEIVAQGNLSQIISSPKSLTGKYLSGKVKVSIKKTYQPDFKDFITIEKAAQFNLKNITVKIPLSAFTCVSGVSGSGKSTLINNILVRHLKKLFYQAKTEPGKFAKISGADKINKIININQAPIGRNVRSNPATYTGLFTLLRGLFANQESAKIKRFLPAHFSFNLKLGRCEHCRGDGVLKFEMHFMPDVFIMCSKCHGKRYKDEILNIKYQGKHIFDVLNLSVNEAINFFKNEKQIVTKLLVLQKVGLGYIKLGQNATDLSGGEAQRVKLASELSRSSTGKTVYVLDEPTSGLHFDDIKKLLAVLLELIKNGNTVIVVEHNLDVIKNADWIIDLGPDGGEKGGRLIFQGTADKITKCQKSYTGSFLKNTRLLPE
ncbi:MAG: excinuclease ABC subunit A [Candidatus Berkelbacteria bacterium Licking1014_7]|uniref:UvrABC system protein A n=1 Tax=Candidatus Berkelbacteria bacterium Licking1014_7 TaxID=2017147 RepID=A0A554LIY0_9BACT|nr:MAG: excinuclease ABC subunit A [Candidatus Berkelbacteria bacterium Licking1014_7]